MCIKVPEYVSLFPDFIRGEKAEEGQFAYSKPFQVIVSKILSLWGIFIIVLIFWMKIMTSVWGASILRGASTGPNVDKAININIKQKM